MSVKCFCRNQTAIFLFLVLVTFAVFCRVYGYDFVNFDDDVYVTENPQVRSGLTAENIAWAFRAENVYWHPLTWISHMMDVQIWGLDPGRHHLTNVLFHTLNAMLLFLALNRMTRTLWRSLFVAALFALHPINVESVAWVAERKNVLSTFFMMLTLLAYGFYAAKPGLARYLMVGTLFILGLLAKPMLVTLPFVFLLLDYWPLDRFSSQKTTDDQNRGALSLILEKIPLFLLAGISIFVSSVSVQAIKSLEAVPMTMRLSNALVSYMKYMGKMFWPFNLAVFYPYPQSISAGQLLGSIIILVMVSGFAIFLLKQHAYFAVGWFWYLGTLVPVIGLIQIGAQSMADRYTYVPLIGLFIMIGWGVPELVARWRYRKIGLGLAAGLVLAGSMILTWSQLQHWKSTVTLFEHALSVTADNYFAHNNLGIAYARQGEMDKAISHYTKALQFKPYFPRAHNNLGNAYARQGRTEEAIAHFTLALQYKPDFAGAHNNLGNVLAAQGKNKEAIFHFSRAQQLQPDFAEVSFNMGSVFARQGSMDDALAQFSRALELKPDFAEAHNSLGVILARKGRFDEAIVHFREALRLKPTFIQAHNNLSRALQEARHQDESSQNGSKPLN